MLSLNSLVSSWLSCYRTFWFQQNHRAYIAWFLLATNVQKPLKNMLHMRHMFLFQGSLSLSVQITIPTTNSEETLVLDIYGFHHKTFKFQGFWLNLCKGWPITKMVYFKPCNKTVTSEEIIRLFMDNIYKYHGLPNDIIFDCGSQFTSKFSQSLFKILNL